MLNQFSRTQLLPGGKGGCDGQRRDGEGDRLPGDDQKPPQTENEIHQMGDEKAEKVALHPVFRKEKIQKKHIHGIGDDVVADADLLLPKAFCHGVGDAIAIQHGNQRRVQPQIPPCLPAAVKSQT